jgi:hypothetical protein
MAARARAQPRRQLTTGSAKIIGTGPSTGRPAPGSAPRGAPMKKHKRSEGVMNPKPRASGARRAGNGREARRTDGWRRRQTRSVGRDACPGGSTSYLLLLIERLVEGPHAQTSACPPVTRRFREASFDSRPLPGHRQGRGASTPAEGLTCFFKAVPSAIRVFAEFGELLEQISRAALVAGAAGRPRGAEHGAVAIGLLVQDRLVLL